MGVPKSRGLFRDHYVVAYLSITGHCRIQKTTSTAIGEHNTLRVKLPTWGSRTNTHVAASKKVGLQEVCYTKSWISPRHTGISIPVYFILHILKTHWQYSPGNPTTLLCQMISQVKGSFWTPRCSMDSMHWTLHSQTINFLSQSNGHGPRGALWFKHIQKFGSDYYSHINCHKISCDLSTWVTGLWLAIVPMAFFITPETVAAWDVDVQARHRWPAFDTSSSIPAPSVTQCLPKLDKSEKVLGFIGFRVEFNGLKSKV